MAVRFILGRSGTGKTHHCLKAIVEALSQPAEGADNQYLLLLVPEQANYQASEAILSNAQITGYSRLHVLSFSRLGYLVLGKNIVRPEITHLGRSMVIQKILRECAGKLNVFADSAKLPGLGQRLADTINQLQQYANTPDDIKNLVSNLRKQQGDALTAAKFADLGIVFEEYQKFIEGKFLDPDIQLASACKAVAGADLVRGAKLWVDGFAGFTTAELALLTELLKVVEDAQIALCLDPATTDIANPDKSKIDPMDLFGHTAETYAELVERIKKCKLKLSPPLILNKPIRFSNSPPLAHIEQNIFNQDSAKIFAGGDIRVVSVPNTRIEVQFVARQITKLVRQNGLRYRDIAVIASDLDSYENYIKTCFEDYGIPVFIDKRRPLNQHPVIELICSAMNAVTNDFPAGEIFAYLKTDLPCVKRDEINLLENYCLAFGITANDWKSDKPWQYAARNAEQFDEERVNLIRKKAIAPLCELKKQLDNAAGDKGAIVPEQFTKIIFDFLEAAEVRKRLSSWVEQAIQKGDYAAADEHRQFYDRLIDIFDEMVEAFEGVSLGCEDYLAILRSAFSQITLAFIPPNLDQVLVGSIERSRHPDLKAVFLIGTTERQFPSPVAFDSILSEEDRLAAQSCGVDLPPGVRQELANRPYLAYIAFTRPSEFLCVTYPAADQKSNEVARSPFVDNLFRLFDDLKEESAESSPVGIENVCTTYELEDILCSSPQPDALLEIIVRDDQLAAIGSRAANALGYKNEATLEKGVIGELFDKQLSSSASRLSTFAECPYRHFSRYILGLSKREEFKLEPPDLGEFYHRVLDRFTKRTVADKINFETIVDDALIKILDEETERICGEDSFISKFAAHSPHNAFMISTARQYLRDCVIAVSQMIRAGGFRPAMSEISFGKSKSAAERYPAEGDSIGELTLTLPDGRRLTLNGRIDRLDIAKIEGRKVAIVFDYKKRSKNSFSWTEFYYCLDIQLAVYMLAVRNVGGKFADDIAGAFYMPIEVGPENVELGKSIDNTPKFARKARGIFNGDYASSLDGTAAKDSHYYNFYITKEGDPYGKYNYLGALKPADFEAFMNFGSRKITDIAGQITSGKITALPYRLGTDSPCEQCEYKPVCRFDWQINNYNLLARVNKEQVLDLIRNADESK
ncbi:MAG: PD-(D/E)XK nuclease family protein [Sedimentisphaerales bacterium]